VHLSAVAPTASSPYASDAIALMSLSTSSSSSSSSSFSSASASASSAAAAALAAANALPRRHPAVAARRVVYTLMKPTFALLVSVVLVFSFFSSLQRIALYTR
jgi:hypothetical protein